MPGPAIDEPIAVLTPNGSAAGPTSTSTPITKGSVVMMTNDNGGIVEGPFTYSPFGSCSNSAGHACPSGEPYRFTGRRWDDETGLLYFRARYYFNEIGTGSPWQPGSSDGEYPLLQIQRGALVCF